MEEQEPSQPRLSAAFPAPPPFWKQFTPENQSQLEDIQRTKSAGRAPSKWTPAELRTLELPPELMFLIPPEPPTAGTYNCFGQELNTSSNLRSLPSRNVPQVYDTVSPNSDRPLNHAFVLHRITKSILLNFLEYVGILSTSPANHGEKVQVLQNLFINAHHLINMYRPHQARETLMLRMEKEIEDSRREIREMKGTIGKVEGVLKELEEEEGKDDGRNAARDVKGANGKANGKLQHLLDELDNDSDIN